MKKNITILALAFLLLVSPLAAPVANAKIEINRHPLAFTAEPTLFVSENSERYKIPWEWEPLTPAYEYSFLTPGFYDPSRPLEVKIYYPQKSDRLKQIFSFDFLSSVWRPVPTKDNPAEQYVSMTTDATSAWLIVLAQPEVMTVGNASWYKYKEGLFAASPDFPKGTVLRVHNVNNGKFVDVTVNDYGPDRKIHPDRVIDLDRVAFEKIAPLGAGITKVRLEVLKEIPTAAAKAATQLSEKPVITASSAIIMMEHDGRVLLNQAESKAVPIASLTKLVAVRVFLDTNPDLKKIVTYKKQDELYNYEHCEPWESSRLRVSDGETMTVENLLYSTLVGSANNAIESLVRASSLSRAEFITRMNKVAKDWGAKETKFVEPSGLAVDNVSSPRDYAIMTKEIFKTPLIQKISTTQTYTFSTLNTKKSHTLNNTNQLLKNTAYEILGSKTGYLHEAGYCLMTRVKTPQGNMVVINLNSRTRAENFADNEKLIRYGLRVLGTN